MIELTKEQIKLKEYIIELNRKNILEKKSVYSTDSFYWASHYSIFNIYEFKHYLVSIEHFQLYFLVHEVKPTWFKYSKMTIEEIENLSIDLKYYKRQKENIILQKMNHKFYSD